LKQAINVYKGRGHSNTEVKFTEWNTPVHTTLADNEFEAIREEIEGCGTKDNIAAKEEHVPEVERQNRVIKGKGEGSYTNSALQEYLDED